MDTTVVYVYILLAGGLGYVLGYIVGRLDLIARRLASADQATHSVGTPQWNAAKRARAGSNSAPADAIAKIDINETKVVLPVNTTGIQKVGDVELGKTTVAADDVSAAANRLAQLKGK